MNERLERRYEVRRIRLCERFDDGCVESYTEPVEDQVFVLRPERDPIAREALRAYAAACGNPGLAGDLTRWMNGLDRD